MLRVFCDMFNDLDCHCTPSVDSILDNRQYTILQSGLGQIMFSVASAQSTMIFTMKSINYCVVDSPPNGGKRPRLLSSLSPSITISLTTLPNTSSSAGGAPQ